MRERLGSSLLGAMSGSVAGWLTTLLASVGGVMHWSIIGGLAALGAAFGYRHGRGVVAATIRAFVDAASD